MTAGVNILSLGFLWAAFKCYIVWDIAHDVFNGGGAPTLDFPIICPVPLAAGTSLILSARGHHPFPGFGFALYLLLAAMFALLLWLFDRHGTPERQQ